MLASIMWSLASQQRRLMSGNKYITCSRDQGLLRAHATAAESSGRRRRRRTEFNPQPQQQAEQQQPDLPEHAQHLQQQQKREDERPQQVSSSSRSEPVQQAQIQQLVSSLGLKRGSEVPRRSRKQRSGDFELPWSPQQSQQPHSLFPDTPCSNSDSNSSRGLGSSPASSMRILSDSSSLVSSSSPHSTSSNDRDASSSSSDGSSDGSSSQRHSVFQPTAEDDAVIDASNRISRFMDFRERCASEVVTKLVELGYDKQLAHKVLKRMQETGMQDDARFAEMFVRGQWITKAQAPARITYELRMRRVAQEHIDAALTAVFGDSKQIAGREASGEAQEASWERLVEVCRQRVEATSGYPQQKRRAKLATWLQRRGHSLGTAFRMFEVLGI